MPIYEYRCLHCHRIFEEWSRHVEDDAVTRACPACNNSAKRLMSHTSFALKGQGWYVTEYGTHKGKGNGEADVPPAAHESAPSSETASAGPPPAQTPLPAAPTS